MCPMIDISTTINCVVAVAENPLGEASIAGFVETPDWRVALAVSPNARRQSIGRRSDQGVARVVLAFRRSILISRRGIGGAVSASRFRSNSPSSDQQRHGVPRMNISNSPRSRGLNISLVDSRVETFHQTGELP